MRFAAEVGGVGADFAGPLEGMEARVAGQQDQRLLILSAAFTPMHPLRHSWFALFLVGFAVVVWWSRSSFDAGGQIAAERKSPRLGKGGASGIPFGAGGRSDPFQSTGGARPSSREELTYGQAWNGPQPQELARFRDWTVHYIAAQPAARAGLEAEGVSLAHTRRTLMRDLIVQDPRQALALTVPAVIRQVLPVAVLAELETRVAGRGDSALTGTQPDLAFAANAPAMQRIAFVGGVSYTAHAYGRRLTQPPKEGISLHGVAIDRELALHESPLRVLEPGEIPAKTAAPRCPVSNLPVPPLAADAGVNLGEPNVVEAGGEVWEFCGTMDHMLESFESRLIAEEDGVDSNGAPRRPLDLPSAWTTGLKKVLVIRVDFSDLPGEPILLANAQDVMDNQVRPFLENASYGLTTLVTTVSSKVYRLPQTASAYAVTDNVFLLYADAKGAAAADYDVSSYDRLIVSLTKVGPSKIPGSQINYSGQAEINGPNVWIYGSFNLSVVAHELGHTYGLWHGNLWQVTDGNPISPSGTSVEYGDPFDVMGHSNNADPYNPWSLNRLGWLPDSAVTTVTQSGTYRIYRFDSKNASLQQPLAIRIYRDGVRWYWIGFRQNAPGNASLTNGAYVFWGFNTPQQSQLLDLTTPGTDATDAALALGATLNDPDYGIRITPVARGGSEPEQYLDVQVTLSPVSQNYVVALGDSGPTLTVPNGLTEVKAIAAGGSHALALKSDGTVVAWGVNSQAQSMTTVPADLGQVASIAAGGDVSGAVRADGTVVLWGAGSSSLLNPPAGLSRVRQLAIGGSNVVAVRTDGSLVSWGDGPTAPADLRDVTTVAACSLSFFVALKSDGTVATWGSSAVAPPAGLRGVIALAAGGEHVLALKADGTVVSWGSFTKTSGGLVLNDYGQTNVPAGLNGVVAVAAGGNLSMALKADGTVVTWGQTVLLGSVPPGILRICGIASSNNHGLILIGSQPVFSSQPESQAAVAGGSVTFAAAAAGSDALTYQWFKNGQAIPGATSTNLTLSNVQTADVGSYSVVVFDGRSFVSSGASLLAVSTPGSDARLANISARGQVGSGSSALVVGFVIAGSQTKTMLLRAVGPGLAQLGVADGLASPLLTLFDGGGKAIVSNSGWGGSATLSNAFQQFGAFSLPANSKDAALLASLPPGATTAQVSGVNNASGIALAEIYDADSAITGSRIANLSARAQVGNGGNVLIAGFVISGSQSLTLLIRAVGPGLQQLGVTGVLANPLLKIFDASGQVIYSNNGWGGGGVLSGVFQQVGAFALAVDSADAAMLITLPSGSYSAEVSGAGDTTGVALIELYQMP